MIRKHVRTISTITIIRTIPPLAVLCACNPIGTMFGRPPASETVVVVRHVPMDAPDSAGVWIVVNGARRAVTFAGEPSEIPTGNRRGADSVLIVVKLTPPLLPPGRTNRGAGFPGPLVEIDDATVFDTRAQTTLRFPGYLRRVIGVRGAAAAAKYGSRAFGGLLEIETTAGRPR